MSPRQRARRRERRRIIRIERVAVRILGRVVAVYAEPTHKGRRDQVRYNRYRLPQPRVCYLLSERWTAIYGERA